MPSKYWIKLYHEVLHDPKMGRLPDRLWRRTIELFLMAGERDQGGWLPDVADMAWTFRMEPAELEADLEALQNGPSIVTKDEGGWFVTKFARRQAPVSAVERKRRQRERDKKQKYYGHDSQDKPVTQAVTIRDTDTDTDTEEDKNVASGAVAPTTFQDWANILQESKNRQSVLLSMFKELYPGRDSPSYSYIGKVARNVGGAGRLADLLWQNSTRPPTGNVLAYVQQVAKGGKKRGAGSDGDQVNIQGHTPTAATADEFYGDDDG